MGAPSTSTNALSGATATALSNHAGAGGWTPASGANGPSFGLKGACVGMLCPPLRTLAQCLEHTRAGHDRPRAAPDAALHRVEIVVHAHDLGTAFHPVAQLRRRNEIREQTHGDP